MTVMRTRGANESRHARASIGSVLLCIAGGIAVFLAVTAWAAACQADTHSSCRNGDASFELVFQLVVAVAGFAATCAVRHFVNRGSYAPARAAFVVAILLLAGWVVLVDAATHGWDDLQVPFFLLTIVVISMPLALIAALIKRMR